MNLLRKLLWVCAAAVTVVVLVWGALLAFGPAVLPLLLVLFDFEYFETRIHTHRRRHEPFRLIPHLRIDRGIQFAFLEAAQVAIALGRGCRRWR